MCDQVLRNGSWMVYEGQSGGGAEEEDLKLLSLCFLGIRSFTWNWVASFDDYP